MCHYMKWTNQIISATNKLGKMIYIMKLLREILDYKNMINIYSTPFESLIMFGYGRTSGGLKYFNRPLKIETLFVVFIIIC